MAVRTVMICRALTVSQLDLPEYAMRRLFSALLILQFWMGPLAAVLPVKAESSLPACCRRHGAHHCALSAEMAAAGLQSSPGTSPVVAAPSHCSSYPSSFIASTERVQALTPSPARIPSPRTKTLSLSAIPLAARQSTLRTRANRGPPSSSNIG